MILKAIFGSMPLLIRNSMMSSRQPTVSLTEAVPDRIRSLDVYKRQIFHRYRSLHVKLYSSYFIFCEK